MAFSVALGCDTFDSASYILFARKERYMTEHGIQRLDQMSYLPCSCPACNSTSLRELREMEAAERTRLLALHNLYLLKTEVNTCKQSIFEGRLWDLVEERAAAHPRVMEAFRTIAENVKLLTDGTATLKNRGLLVRGDLDMRRPELETARVRLEAATRRRERRALVVLGDEPLTLGAPSPAQSSPRVSGCDVYRVHPCLGIYPAELDFVYPFTQTIAADVLKDVPEIQDNARKTLRRLGYTSITFSTAGLNEPSKKGREETQMWRKGAAKSATSQSRSRSRSRQRQKGRDPSPPSTSARSR
jgi:7-cyano-7-deazaguanine tRNA-ribosyltransferase